MTKKTVLLHKLTAISFITQIGVVILFMLSAEGNYMGIDTTAQKNTFAIVVNSIFAVVHLCNIILSVASLLLLIIKLAGRKKITAVDIILGVYPLLFHLAIVGFDINNLLKYFASPIRIIRTVLS